MDAVERLGEEHRRLRALMAGIEEAVRPVRRERLLDQVRSELRAHFGFEESLLFPACREAVLTSRDSERFRQGARDHARVWEALEGLTGWKGTLKGFRSKAMQARSLLEDHIRLGETTLFPLARRALGRPALLEMVKNAGKALARPTITAWTGIGGPRRGASPSK